MSDRFLRRRVLVTGSSRGIGRAIALDLARGGWNVAVHYAQDLEGAIQCQAELGASASGCYQAELRDLSAAKELFKVVEQDGVLDALVNNAGVYLPISFNSDDEDAFDRCWQDSLSINLQSPVYLTRSAIKSFASRGGGKILNVASRVGFKGEANAAIYAATKAALINLTRSLAVELAPFSIGVFGLAPGWVETAMVREGMQDRLPEVLATLPLGRMATPEDCAAAASFLLSDAAAYLSGQVIDINGASYFH